MVNTDFARWAKGFSGCDGGDIGSRANRSIWVCGIEWGGNQGPDGLKEQIKEDVNNAPRGYKSWRENIAYIFNWQVMKLLAAFAGRSVSSYKQFAEETMPFVDGSSGYFKMNLYPVAFRNTNRTHWISDYSDITGFESKNEYCEWCNKERLRGIRAWVQQYQPKLVICLGRTYHPAFTTAFANANDNWVPEDIDGRCLSWTINDVGTMVAVIPFMVGRNGLVRNVSIQKVGERIGELLGCVQP